jgi:Leucine-rich repeat (LRR) protein
LYLHANQIENIQEVQKLGKLTQLKNLTLHGNPLEKTNHYRALVLKYIPYLKHLDFSGITKVDRATAAILFRK